MPASGAINSSGCLLAERVPSPIASASNGFHSSRSSGIGSMMDQSPRRAQQSGGSAELSQLLARVAGRDAGSLKGLYERTSAKLYGICLRLLGDEAEAQDALQEVYLKVWRRASSFDVTRASGITWLATIARNAAIDRLRARRVQADDLTHASEVPDESPSSFDVLDQAEDSARLYHCLDEVEEPIRNLIRSAFFDGATYVQLAEREGVPLPTMKSRVRRGLLRLRRCLER
jgi:RNA polymerase sigma-70 factor, ECF subfamily